MLTIDEYLSQHGAGHEAELTDELRANAQVTVDKGNQLLAAFGDDRGQRSGWRPQSVNDATPNAARHSRHITCEAIDINDEDRKLQEWCMDNQAKLVEFGLWMEHPIATPDWLHVQTVAPPSGKRAFFPNATYALRFKEQGLA